MNAIVGIAGRRGAGKDTAAHALTEMGFTVEKFAGGLKEMLRGYLRYCQVQDVVIEAMLEGNLKEVPTPYFQGRTPRYVMQTLGTEWGRNMIGERLWIDGFDYHIEGNPAVVITDLRFPNEGQHIWERGGLSIRVVDPNRVIKDGDDHPSEVLVDSLKVHVEIYNDKRRGVQHFHDAVRAVVSAFSTNVDTMPVNQNAK